MCWSFCKSTHFLLLLWYMLTFMSIWHLCFAADKGGCQTGRDKRRDTTRHDIWQIERQRATKLRPYDCGKKLATMPDWKRHDATRHAIFLRQGDRALPTQLCRAENATSTFKSTICFEFEFVQLLPCCFPHWGKAIKLLWKLAFYRKVADLPSCILINSESKSEQMSVHPSVGKMIVAGFLSAGWTDFGRICVIQSGAVPCRK